MTAAVVRDENARCTVLVRQQGILEMRFKPRARSKNDSLTSTHCTPLMTIGRSLCDLIHLQS